MVSIDLTVEIQYTGLLKFPVTEVNRVCNQSALCRSQLVRLGRQDFSQMREDVNL